MADTFIVPGIGIVAVFGWLAVHEWVESRRKEREEFYRSETLRRLFRKQPTGHAHAVSGGGERPATK